MKKVLALVLAVMMLATVAFAAEVYNPDDKGTPGTPGQKQPGDKIKIDARGIIFVDSGTYSFTPTGSQKLIKDINSSNYSISAIKYDDGKNLVESVKFNDKEDRVEIKLKQDYTSTKAKTLNMTFTLKGKKSGKSSKPADIDVRINYVVNYGLDKALITINDTDDVDVPTTFAKNTLYQVQAGTAPDGTKAKYGTMEFTAEDSDVEVEVRVYEDDELYLYNETDANDDVLKAYADADADITFLNFKGTPTFNATATVRFYKEEDTFVYGMKDGKLTNINAKWDDDEGCFILKTRTLGGYVFSDKKLNVAAADASTNNPDTGANDVVGIATALAAVALVSAAAVSLKK